MNETISVAEMAGAFTECVKTGFYFSMESDDRVFTGDLHYNFIRRKFVIKGIPTVDGKMVHVIPKSERGPIALMGLVLTVEASEVRNGLPYTDMVVGKMRIAETFAEWVEYWYGDRAVSASIRESWEVVSNLAWVKSA